MHTFSRILAATDFSAAGHAALARAGQIAAQQGAELRVIHAAPDWNLFAHGSPRLRTHYEELSKKAELLLRRATDWLATEFGIHVTGEVHRGRASQVITGTAALYQPHLLVLGAHGEHAPEASPIALGATTLKTITQVRVPLLLVREPEVKPYKTCLAAIGSSDEQARRVVQLACVMAGRGDCHVVRAYEVPYLERLKASGVGAGEISTCSQDTELAARLAANPPWPKEEPGANMHMHLVRGRPVPSVLTEITRHAPQFVAVGRHERTALEPDHSLMSCTGMQIAYHCQVDVLIVP